MTLLSILGSLQTSKANQELAKQHGLNITTVSWEDTARSKNSCVGPNISDLTLNTSETRMPMIRKPNFTDVTGDLDISDLQVTVGNEASDGVSGASAERTLRRIPLKDYLNDLAKYAGPLPDGSASLLKERDEVILCSSQACILPLGESGEVSFVPQIFNYQSTKDDPAVLVIVSSSQGTSAHVITKYAQKLYFNRHGQATQFLAKRLAQDRAERNVPLEGKMTAEEQDRNVLVIYQVPLQRKELPAVENMWGSMFGYAGSAKAESCYYVPTSQSFRFTGSQSSKGGRGSGVMRGRGMDHAMLRASDTSEGPFPGLGSHKLVRDEKFPIRATFQFYRVTDEAEIGEELFADIAQKIEQVYALANEKGSLVIDSTSRITEKGKVSEAPKLPDLPRDATPLFAGFNA